MGSSQRISTPVTWARGGPWWQNWMSSCSFSAGPSATTSTRPSGRFRTNMPARNAIVIMGGGPTVVMNNSLRSIIETCREFPERFGTVYGAWHGIEGLLCEELLDLSAQPREEIQLLRTTPAAGSIGTTRYKLQAEEDLHRIIDVLRVHNVGYFFGIGGNDTQEVCLRVAEAAEAVGYELYVIGVPKTIDTEMRSCA